ncbi:MAG TPA: alanine--tRNA ligase [Candidatus Faecimonas intestinavium]|nr:alanine--tRNA ligase [Candidatus Faecimonas intestinavium]
MKYMSHDDIRNTWFRFFESKGHRKVESASLVPINDDSLLWINAGVTPLKKYFDGREVPECRRLVNIQKCIRTNDIENVGITKRHQTFFEMMGNFSVGDYFKTEAIEFAFELLTGDEWFSIPKDLLYVTVYPDDHEAYQKWIEVGLDESHLVKLEENFWEIGEGPCGPDSEIFFDRGEKYDPNHDALEKFKNDEEQERFVEIWNNVFSQFNSMPGVPREEYKELPSKNIDTGAGLERWCCIFQDVDSNFETDLFQPIIKHIEELVGFSYDGQKEFKIIADHIRAITFALADGAFFDNNGRGYVLRRLLRRSVRYGKNLGLEGPFLYKLVSEVVETMKDAYPYLTDAWVKVETLVLEEEKLFLKTLEAGERRLKELVEESIDGTISGEDAFRLYDTYGFPFELTEEYLTELGYKVSKEEFDKYMNIQKELAKKNAKNKSAMASQKKVLLDFKEESQFVYGIYRLKTNVLAIFSKDSIVDRIDHDCYIALKRTCCYAESGGQVSDTGMIIGKNFKARLLDAFKAPNGQHIHKVKLLDGFISVNDECEIVLDKDRRKRTECNHSSVHMLQYALQQCVSSQIRQAGSYVDGDKLRFDFTYSGKMTDDKIIEVENFVNDMINKRIIISTEIMPIDKAKQIGAMALFNEKYGDVVRVVKIGKSIELCGGTHATNTKDIERFAIYSYESKGSNLYRIEATTDGKIEDTLFNIIKPYNDEMIKLLMKAKEIMDEAKEVGIRLEFDVDINHEKPESYKDIIYNRNELQYVQQEVRDLEKKYQQLREKQVLSNLDVYREHIKDYNGTFGLLMTVENKDVNLLKSVADAMIEEMGTGFVFFANVKDDGSINFLSRSSCHANSGLIVKDAAVSSLGNGGGSPTFAQGGGKTKDALPKIYTHIEKVLRDEK